MPGRPDRPLVVKCSFDKANKKITFTSARNCSYDILKDKVEKCFSLSPSTYAISWKDDDGEITHILTDTDLTDAIEYFCTGDDAPLSSAASILSGRSFGTRKVTLRVAITVDYDGPSLSDTSSLASLDEFRSRNGSQRSFSFGAPSVDLDDDSITVSSRDQMRPASIGSRGKPPTSSSSRNNDTKASPTVHYSPRSNGFQTYVSTERHASSSKPSLDPEDTVASDFGHDRELSAAMERYPADPSAVLERLKLRDALGEEDSEWEVTDEDDRGARWLREQKERAIRSMLGVLPEPSVSDDDSFDDLGGDLLLERNTNGKYYYTYNTPSASQTQGSNDEEFQVVSDFDEPVSIGKRAEKPRPTSMHLDWLAAQQLETEENRKLHSSASTPSFHSHHSDPVQSRPQFVEATPPPDFLSHYQLTSPPAEMLTECSNCGVFLDSIRYVCSTCGENPPAGTSNRKYKDDHGHFTYPPQTTMSSSQSSTSQFYVGSSDSFFNSQRHSPYHLHAGNSLFPSSSVFSSQTQVNPTPVRGYELCMNCFESAGIHHAIEAGLGSPASNQSMLSLSSITPHDSHWRRAAPKKGQTRHAFQEKVWGDFGWEDIAQDEGIVSSCSICSAVTTRQRYKCSVCDKFHLCRACYSLVHDLHPSHAFVLVPDKPIRPSEPEYIPTVPPDPNDEQSLEHPGVACAHCLRPIVGARFHCAICDSLDICSNCEAAGLPGNLDSADGGHNSSHILIKIPFPLESHELENASRRAIQLWQGRDAAVAISASRSAAKSEADYTQTIIGGGTMFNHQEFREDHRIPCSSCNKSICGVRYQCAHCPSYPLGYNLCSRCEPRSWALHDPMHIFFKITRPVQIPLESPGPFLPHLYQTPAGPTATGRCDDPRAYLKTLVHKIAVCDRCMNHIEGEWFRCANCSLDLCDSCEGVDTHDDTHIFVVIKSMIDLKAFKSFTNPDDPKPIISINLYGS